MRNTNAVELIGKAAIQGTEEWLQFRKTHISATDIAPIMGLSPWESVLSLYASKTSDTIEKKESPYIEWGSRLEPVIIDKVVEALGIKNDKRGKVYVDGWRMASLDGEGELDGERVGIEAKTASDRRKWFNDDGSECVPEYYKAQAMWQMLVCGFKKVVFTVLITSGGLEWFHRIVEFDEEAAAEFDKGACWFFDHLQSRTQIEPSEEMFKDCHYTESAKKNLAAMLSRTTEASKKKMNASLVNKCIELDKKIKEQQAELENIKTKIVNELDGNEEGVDKNGNKLVKITNGRWGKVLKIY